MTKVCPWRRQYPACRHRNQISAIIISAFDYTNDASGRRTGRTFSETPFSSTLGNSFGYNGRNEITSTTMRNGNSTYSLHHIGNRVTGAPAAQPAFDDDGNLTSDGKGKWFSWNAENRMIEVRDYDQTPADGAVRTRFVYDSQGRRVQKLNESYDLATDNWTATSDHRYFYDGWNLLFEIDTLNSDPTRYYVWGPDLSGSLQGAGGVGGLLFTLSDGVAHAVSYDANGNISEYIDLSDGSVDAHLEYDAFGRTIASTGTAPAYFGFSTKYLDEETGYYYYGFRYYDPETGRWPNRDSIEEQGGYNVYGFVGNDSVGKLDYLGKLELIISYKSKKNGKRVILEKENDFDLFDVDPEEMQLDNADVGGIAYINFTASEPDDVPKGQITHCETVNANIIIVLHMDVLKLRRKPEGSIGLIYSPHIKNDKNDIGANISFRDSKEKFMEVYLAHEAGHALALIENREQIRKMLEMELAKKEFTGEGFLGLNEAMNKHINEVVWPKYETETYNALSMAAADKATIDYLKENAFEKMDEPNHWLKGN